MRRMKDILFGETLPTEVKNPFNCDCIESIHMHANKNMFGGGFRFTGSVEFKNDNTEGTQKFKADNLGELYVKIQNFCMTLEK